VSEGESHFGFSCTKISEGEEGVMEVIRRAVVVVVDSSFEFLEGRGR
jgi:hypothetical protein